MLRISICTDHLIGIQKMLDTNFRWTLILHAHTYFSMQSSGSYQELLFSHFFYALMSCVHGIVVEIVPKTSISFFKTLAPYVGGQYKNCPLQNIPTICSIFT